MKQLEVALTQRSGMDIQKIEHVMFMKAAFLHNKNMKENKNNTSFNE